MALSSTLARLHAESMARPSSSIVHWHAACTRSPWRGHRPQRYTVTPARGVHGAAIGLSTNTLARLHDREYQDDRVDLSSESDAGLETGGDTSVME
jgi:hypothetical protein